MPKIVLANPHSRAMVARPDDIPPESRQIYDVIASRMLWSLECDDIAVLPGPISTEFVAYVRDMLSLDRTPTVLSLRDHDRQSWYPADNPRLLRDLQDRIATGDHPADRWTVTSYIRDRDIAHWERLLGVTTGYEPYSQDLAALVNSKSVFRTLALSDGIPVPEGYVVDAGRELVDVVATLLHRTGSVIVKQDRNAGGDGNVLLSADDGVTGFGAFTVVRLPDITRETVTAELTALGLAHEVEVPAGGSPAGFVVEVYHPHSRTFSSEIRVPRSGAPVLLNYGDMRMEPVWNGYIFPPLDLHPTLHAQLCADSQQIGVIAQRLGYQGLMNIDAIVDPAGRLLYTEFNGRAGGATNIDTIARRLLGDGYLRDFVLITRNGKRTPRPAELAARLDEKGLHFAPERASGIIIANDDLTTATTEYIAVGHDRAEAESLERDFDALRETWTRDAEAGF